MEDHLPERDDPGTQALRFEVVKIMAADADQALEEIAVGQRPLPAALAAEEPEGRPGRLAQRDLRGDVVVASERMLGVEAFLRTDGIGGVDEVAQGPEPPWMAGRFWARMASSTCFGAQTR